MKILIPTCKEDYSIPEMYTDYPIFASRTKASASVNRNLCLDQISIGEIAIMIDDDIQGFYPGWVEDLLKAFDIPDVAMVSARLLKSDGTFGPTCSMCPHGTPEEIRIYGTKHCIMPTAAIAFINRGHRFDEEFRGSGWEDNAWMAEYVIENRDYVFIQSNRCKLIHANEMKNQHGPNWEHNKQHFWRKYPNGIPSRNHQSFSRP